MVVIDPVDKNRNVASALKSATLFELIGAARAFLIDPSIDFFFPPKMKKFSLDVLKSTFENRDSSILFILTDTINAVPDVLWGQLYKTQRSLRKLLKNNDFKILRDVVWTNEKTLTFFIIELENYKLPRIKLHIGPPLKFEEQSALFLSKYSRNITNFSVPYIHDKKWVVLLNRIHNDAISFIKEKLMYDDKNLGIPKPILNAFKRKLRIFVNYEITDQYRNNKEFAAIVSSFLEGKPFWLKSYYN